MVDNVNATAADRAALIAAGRRRGAAIAGYVFATSREECSRRNRDRVGRERVPEVAIGAAAKRFQRREPAEGFDRLERVRADAGRFDASSTPRPPTRSSCSRRRRRRASAGAILLNDRSPSPLAHATPHAAGAPLGEVFSFLSSLYFRGKLTYARAFGASAGGPLRRVRHHAGRRAARPGRADHDRSPAPLRRRPRCGRASRATSRRCCATPRRCARLAGERCRIVLLGSVASSRYVEPLLEVFGDRLFFPPTFVGRGDMSRGGLLLRCVAEGRELEYAPVAGAARHGPRPPRSFRPRRRRVTLLLGPRLSVERPLDRGRRRAVRGQARQLDREVPAEAAPIELS